MESNPIGNHGKWYFLDEKGLHDEFVEAFFKQKKVFGLLKKLRLSCRATKFLQTPLCPLGQEGKRDTGTI